jgi:hypothetical protein
MADLTHISLASYQLVMKRMQSLHRLVRAFQPIPLSELLLHVERATTPHQLTKGVNAVQSRLWDLPKPEQSVWRERLSAALRTHVLYALQAPLRLEAARWLRMLTQAGLVTDPQEIFVTLVTSAVRTHLQSTEARAERKAYLKMIFECFWPFRAPHPAFPPEMFPDASIFSPLAPLLEESETDVQDVLISIFAELPDRQRT